MTLIVKIIDDDDDDDDNFASYPLYDTIIIIVRWTYMNSEHNYNYPLFLGHILQSLNNLIREDNSSTFL